MNYLCAGWPIRVPMQMWVLAFSGGFTPVAPMLFTSQLTLPIADIHRNKWQIQKEKSG